MIYLTEGEKTRKKKDFSHFLSLLYYTFTDSRVPWFQLERYKGPVKLPHLLKGQDTKLWRAQGASNASTTSMKRVLKWNVTR